MWRNMPAMSWTSSCSVVFAGHDQQILGQRQLPLAQDGVGRGEQFLRPAPLEVGRVALAADRQQQRMHARRIDGVHRVQAGNHGAE